LRTMNSARLPKRVRSFLRTGHHAVFNVRGKFWTATYQTTVRDVDASFYVGNWKERWRATDLMGERQMIETFVDQIEPGDVCWDVGAAIGTYSVIAARAGADVVAFEPVDSNHHRLLENAALNDVRDKLTHHAVALSDSLGTTTFRLSSDRTGEGTHRIDAGGGQTVLTVPGEAIDPAPDVIKIDVEGHEQAVLDGLGDSLRKARVVLVEIHEQHGVDPVAIRDTLDNAGFAVTELETGRSETYIVGLNGGEQP